jgi:hypothetical protein
VPSVVSLDVLPADVPAEYAPAMVAGCSDAIAEGSCAMASTLPESTRPEAVALVLWQGEDYLQVTVRVGRGNGQWVQRVLTFSERDSISERFTTVGLTVATLVGETAPLPEPSAVPSPVQPAVTTAPAAVPVKPAVAATASSASYLFHADVAALVGPSWDDAIWQKGGYLSVGLRIPHSPFVLHAFGSYAVSSGPKIVGVDLQSSWLTGGLGAGVAGTWQALAVYGTAALELGGRWVRVERNGNSASDSELPFRLRLSASFPAGGPVGGFAGALLRIPPGGGGETDAQQLRGPALATELLAGLQVRL